MLRVHAPREVVIQRPESGELGFKVNGGNAVGIFVSAVGNASIGLKKMDQLLELEGCNLRQATKEDVMEALTKVTRNPTTNQVKVLAQFNPESKLGKGLKGEGATLACYALFSLFRVCLLERSPTRSARFVSHSMPNVSASFRVKRLESEEGRRSARHRVNAQN